MKTFCSPNLRSRIITTERYNSITILSLFHSLSLCVNEIPAVQWSNRFNENILFHLILSPLYWMDTLFFIGLKCTSDVRFLNLNTIEIHWFSRISFWIIHLLAYLWVVVWKATPNFWKYISFYEKQPAGKWNGQPRPKSYWRMKQAHSKRKRHYVNFSH